MMPNSISRRRLLRGALQGSAVSVGLPLLDLFLNDSGTALADGTALPTCFGTWFWPLGFCYGHWQPEQTGRDYTLPDQLRALRPIQDKINLFSGMEVFLDGANGVHYSGPQAIMTGRAVDQRDGFGRSIDDVLADKLRVRTRFPLLNIGCNGNPNYTWSARSANAMTPAEVSPVALYQRIFGSGFQDPNAAEFTPDPAVMLRKSALSAVKEDRQELLKQAGAADRQRLDEFFTSLRDLEQKLALELEKPEPMAACEVGDAPAMEGSSLALDDALAAHDLFAGLISHALACGQTRIFSMNIHRDVVLAGDPTTNHGYTHNEPVDPALGYQPQCYWFANKYMEALRTMVNSLDSIKEGDGTLLDRTLMLVYTDQGDARLHTVKNIPMITAGRAGGAMKTGLHISAPGSSCTRLGLTCQQAMGVQVASWGWGSNRVTEPFSEVLG